MELEDISAEVRWELATKTAQSLFVNYGLSFWTEGGKEVKYIADFLNLPVTSTIEVSKSWKIIRSILMGRCDHKTLEEAEDHVIDCFTSCPILKIHEETGTATRNMPQLCQAHSKSAIDALNPKYNQHFTKRMCKGDAYCESIIEIK
ncbi:hypothetical protein [Methanobacterium sp. ACI-7]|uniref:hypothetical protein n=1 Tax=unclassified Methanobacterium TaxID=2627676 RepID=UPI0039C11022